MSNVDNKNAIIPQAPAPYQSASSAKFLNPIEAIDAVKVDVSGAQLGYQKQKDFAKLVDTYIEGKKKNSSNTVIDNAALDITSQGLSDILKYANEEKTNTKAAMKYAISQYEEIFTIIHQEPIEKTPVRRI